MSKTLSNSGELVSRRSPPNIGALMSALVGVGAGVVVNHYGAVLLWSATGMNRFSWSIPRERDIEIIVIAMNALLAALLLGIAVRQLASRGFQQTVTLLLGFSLGCFGYLLVGFWVFAQLVL